MAGSKMPRSSLVIHHFLSPEAAILLVSTKTQRIVASGDESVIHLKAGHAQINQKSDIFELQIGSFQGRSFPDRWSRGTKTLGTRVEK